jgi:hypothetical protein
MKTRVFLAIALWLMMCGAALGEMVFFDSFEAGMQNWNPWVDVLCHPGPPPPTHYGCDYFGPNPVFQSNSHPHTGIQCARQEQAMPAWYGSMRTVAALPADQTIRLSVWQFEDANPMFLQPATKPPQPGDPRQYHNHDQVQGWVALMGDGDTPEEEFLALGVHAHWASPAPVLNWWQNVSWSTATEGWAPTTTARVQGFRHLEIVVHPYTGSVGDVEFFIDGVKVGEGSRKTTATYPNGIPINRIGLGSSPAHMTEDYTSNTYEFFWYDDVKVTVGPPGDFDGDGDADLIDFAHFQLCFNGPNRPAAAAGCEDTDMDADSDVDLIDFAAFQACFNGPNRPAVCP